MLLYLCAESTIDKKVFVEEYGQWKPLNRNLHLGEKIKVVVSFKTLESLSYLQLTDWLPAGLEVEDFTSSYKFEKNNSYYFEHKLASNNYYFS